MERRTVITLFLVIAALLFATLLHYSAGEERLSMGLTAVGFGWLRVLVVHLLAAIPIGFVIPLGLNVRATIVAALVLSILPVAMAPEIVAYLDVANVGFLVRLLARCAVAAALVVPWVYLFRGIWRIESPRSHGTQLALVMLAVVPPAAFALRVQEAHRARFQQFQSTGRIVRACWELRGLIDLGQTQPIDNQLPVAMLTQLDRQVLGLQAQLSLASSATPKVKLEHAFALVQLDRLDEAAAELKQLGPSDLNALMLLGAVYRAGKKWPDAERVYRGLVATTPDPITYQGWAESLVALGQPVEAEAAYHEAFKRLPDHAAFLHYQLGMHYTNGGRPVAALDEFAKAEQLDASLKPQIEAHERRLRTSTPGCLIPIRER